MRRFIINICLIITFLIIYFLQSNLFSWFKIAGIMPNLFVVLVLFVGLYAHKIMGVTYGIIFGLMLDCFLSKKIGPTAIMLGAVGIIGVLFDKNFSKENRITLLVMVISATIVFEAGEYIIGYFIYKYNIELVPFINILLIECGYNALLTIILYPLIRNFGNKIETEYKGNDILTKYF